MASVWDEILPVGYKRPGTVARYSDDLEEIGINARNWVDSAQDRNYRRALLNVALNLRVS